MRFGGSALEFGGYRRALQARQRTCGLHPPQKRGVRVLQLIGGKNHFCPPACVFRADSQMPQQRSRTFLSACLESVCVSGSLLNAVRDRRCCWLLSYFSAGAAHSERPTGPVSESVSTVFPSVYENTVFEKVRIQGWYGGGFLTIPGRMSFSIHR